MAGVLLTSQGDEKLFWEIIRYILMFGLGAALMVFGATLVRKAIEWFWRTFGIRIRFGIWI